MNIKNDFTPREVEVLNLLFDGLHNKEIAAVLNISVHTVKSHLEAIFPKLNVHNRLRAVLQAVELGLIKQKKNP